MWQMLWLYLMPKSKKLTAQYGFNSIDVFGFTVDLDGFSNGNFHIDQRDFGFKAIYEIER